MSDKELQTYVNDMLAVENELHSAFRRQKEQDNVKRYGSAHQLVSRTEDTIDRHLATLKQCAERVGGESTLKKAVGSVVGAAAGIFDKLRADAPVSRVLRDDNTALTFACNCYEMLHTTALALGDDATAQMALSHFKDYTPLIVQFSRIMPEVLIEELADDGRVTFDRSVAQEAVRNTQEAWAQASQQ